MSRDGYFFAGLSVYALMVFKIFQKLPYSLYKYEIFICFVEINYLLYFEKVTENLLRIHFSVVCPCSLVLTWKVSTKEQGIWARYNL